MQSMLWLPLYTATLLAPNTPLPAIDMAWSLS